MKTIFVAGAGRGLGNAVAERFAREGWRPVLLARSAAHLTAYVKEFQEKGIDAAAELADLSDFARMSRLYPELLARYGTPDAVFYNVGVTVADGAELLSAETLLMRYRTDVLGAYHLLRLAATNAFAEKRGAFLVTGGGLAIEPSAAYLPLSMDKAALRAMVQALVPVMAARGIYLGTVQVTGAIGGSERFMPQAIAEVFWQLASERRTHEVIY